MQKFIMNIFNKDIISNSAVLESEAKRKRINLNQPKKPWG